MSESISAIGKKAWEVVSAKCIAIWKEFAKFVKSNPQYLLCSVVYYILASFLLGSAFISFFIALLSYIITLFVVFTPLGETILRFFEHVRKIETNQEKAYLLPLFQEVYQQAKEQNPELGHIELCIVDKMTVNACALGKRTIAVTKGAIDIFSPDELKALMAHEIAHIVYGDSIAKLYTTVGNGIFTVFVLATQMFIFIAEWIEKIATKSKSSFSPAWIFITAIKLLFMLILLVVQFLMKMVITFSSRRSEFRADRYACELGYGEKLVEALYLLEKMQLGADATVIQRMVRDHPRITARIERLETLLDRESSMQGVPLPLS